MHCPECRHWNLEDSAYCSRCGTRLEPRQVGIGNGREGERRQLTVMFCDLVDSTGLGERLDPEELRGVLATYEATCGRVIERFEGHVAQYRGDGLLVYFSYPQAHEDDAERAVKAGLEIVSSLAEAGARLEPAVQLRVRVGIHTGPVVVGDMGPTHRETVALGHTLNLAARLEAIAVPDSVVVSAETLRLVSGLFATEDLGTFRLKGIAQPVAAYRVLRSTGVRGRLDLGAATALTPLVGREQDVAVILDRWDRVGEGSGQVVLISGEAGIGKSRLVRALQERLSEERHTWVECRGSPHHTNSAFHPVIELLREGLRFAADAPPADQLGWLERAVDVAGIDRDAVVPLLAKLLSLPPSTRYAPLELSPDAQRRRTLDALVNWVCGIASLQPAVVVVEDLHWADPSTLELLGTLIERVAGAQILLLATFRPTFDASWSSQPSHVTQLAVQPLTRRQAIAMVKAVAGGVALSPDTLDRLVRKTDGVPLYIEELTKNLLESDLDVDASIPATLQDSLMARLDRLGAAKEIAQLGALLGRAFSYELIAATTTADVGSLERGLRQVTAAGLVYQRGEPPEAVYAFKHALIQDAAYQSLLKESRRAGHARVARILVERFPERVTAEPEEAARHCEAGGLSDQAIGYRHHAAQLATDRSAYAEAIEHLGRALELLVALPESPVRSEREVVLQVALGASIGASRGWGNADAQRSYGRARELCEQLGESPQLFPAMRGLVVYYTSHAEFDTALDLCTRLLRLAERMNDSSQLLLAHYHLGVTYFFRGDLRLALEHFERAEGCYDPVQHRSLSAVYQTDPGVNVRIWMAWPLWMLGFPDRALEKSREGIAMARAAAHPFSLGYALVWTAVVHLWRGERGPARELSEEAIEIAREHTFAAVLAGAGITRSVARLDPRADDDEIAAAIADFQQAVADFGTSGSEGAGRPHTLGQVADALAGVGRGDLARMAVEAALACSESTAQRYWDAELHRLKGELLLRDPATHKEAQQHLRLALDLARKQGARMLELRAVLSLSRFLRRQESRENVDDVIGAIHRSFTEGFDRAELVEARALLRSNVVP